MKGLRMGGPLLAAVVTAGAWALAQAQEKPRLAVLDFLPVGHTDKQPAGPLADKVSETVQNTAQYRLVNRSAVRQRMDERDWARTAAVDQSRRATQLGKELDAAWIIWGRYTDMGRLWSLTLFLLNVSTGDQAAVVTEDVSGAPDALAGELLKVAPQGALRLLMQAGKRAGPIYLPGLPDLPPVSLPPMPAGVDELEARCRQVQAVHAQLEKLRETHTEKHPHVVFFRDKEAELAKALVPDVKAAMAVHERQYAEMREYYKPNHPAMQALQRRLDDLRGTLRSAEGFSVRRPKELTIDLGGGVTMKMVLIPAGTFTMGSPASEANRADDEVQHEVTISKPFYMGIHEVTQAQWEAVMGNNPSHFQGRDLPVEQVCWNDCQDFIRRLSAKVPGGGFRLPTEAEWEYACRAETQTPFHTGATISTDEANYDGNYTYGSGRKGVYRQKTMPVGSFKPNAWGLYDMHGNVWEWCADWYGEYPRGRVTDPKGPANGQGRVLRGGSWYFYPQNLRSAVRSWGSPGIRYYFLSGFRVAVDVK